MRFRISPGALALPILTALSGILLPGCGDPKPDPTYASRDGEVMLARGNCMACHEASAETVARIRPLIGPRLLADAAVGARLSPTYMAAFIADPHATKRGTRMPQALHALDGEARAEAARSIAAYLASQRPADWASPQPTLVLPDLLANGERLYRTIGCAACHGAADHDRWAKATHFDALVALLGDPLATHPSGLMPNVPLGADEARAIAAYMLTGQAKDDSGTLRVSSSPGLRVEYFEQPMTSDGLPDDAHNPSRIFALPSVSIDFPHRDEEFGVRYIGTLDVPADGEYTFHLGSDDGSRLLLDGKLVIDHWGPHGFAWKSSRMTLKKGPVAFRLVYFEISVDNELRLEWSGPGLKRGPIVAERLSHETVALTPLFEADWVTPEAAKRGEALFSSSGCASCHAAPTTTAPKFADLDATAGCLADPPNAAALDFGLDGPSRQLLRDVVDHRRDLTLALPPTKVVEHSLQRMGCMLCHQRNGEGGPNALNAESFVADGSAELGDQGRLPPRLDGVGDKFRPEALARVLASGEKVRPYMLTRMPVFGESAVDGLAAAFTAADRIPAHDAAPTFSVESAQAG
ncbi:MAG: hypothetical protein JNL80_02300, partial [Phycisphaerae bacterium]|nr:hypothetical protein [Phycisphaerae bacterium]